LFEVAIALVATSGDSFSMRPPLPLRNALLLAGCLMAAAVLRGQSVVFSTGFESGVPAAFGFGGALSGLGTVSLPTDGGGMASVNQSSWLGSIGQGIAKNANASGEVVR
jgi:hypothetical protein